MHSHRLRNAEASRWLSNIDDVQRELQLGAAVRATAGPEMPTERFYDFNPSISKVDWEDESPFISPKSLPMNVRDTHDWSFQLADEKRRKSLLGVDRRSITGIHVRSGILPHFKSTGWVHPSLADVADAAMIKAEEKLMDEGRRRDELEVSKGSDVAMIEKFVLGWRCTYRRAAPEHPLRDVTAKRLMKKYEQFGYVLTKCPDAFRHMPIRPMVSQRASQKVSNARKGALLAIRDEA
jgi:hypothetical protein